ncbi:MAG: hypothetical protein SGJ03_11750 [Alphaproteobacteria bacterium]|nr:hypothetical protein [Alphaproteobacteria bacterium]
MRANVYPEEQGFNCPNQSLGAQAALLSDELLKTIGQKLCSKDVAQVQMLRGTDSFYVDQRAITRQLGKRRNARPLILSEEGLDPEPREKSILVANIEPQRIDTNRDLLDEIKSRVRNLDAIDPCSRRKDCDSDDPNQDITTPRDDRDDRDVSEVDDDQSGHGDGGDDGDSVSDHDDHEGIETVEDDHSGPGGDSDDDHSGSSGGEQDGNDDDDNSGSNSGSGHSG